MVLRLILVGLVSGLGLSSPTQRDLVAMSRSAQDWVVARLAEWETPTAPESENTVFVVVPAETALPETGSTVPPARISDEEFGLALDDTVALFAQDKLADAPREMDQLVKNDEELPGLEATEALAIDLPFGPDAFAADVDESNPTELALDGPTQPAPQTSPVEKELAAVEVAEITDQVFANVIDEVVTTFDHDLATIAKVDATPAMDATPATQTVENKEVIATEDIQVATPNTDEARELSLASDTSKTQLSHAVSLTRQAVIAWASLLHGAAVVATAP